MSTVLRSSGVCDVPDHLAAVKLGDPEHLLLCFERPVHAIQLHKVHWDARAVRRDRCANDLRYSVQIKPIKTKKDYRAALKEIESLMAAKIDTPEGDRLDVLATLVEAYERSHFPMELPDAVEAIKFRMEQACLTVKDLEPVIGRKNRVYEVLSRKRPLTLRMIEGLHARFGIPAESLLRQRIDHGTTSSQETEKTRKSPGSKTSGSH